METGATEKDEKSFDSLVTYMQNGSVLENAISIATCIDNRPIVNGQTSRVFAGSDRL